jgi:D,D-heptose 1,7-bisphosphate phosphatase
MINQAVILVGGKGSRLGKITKKIPKPLLRINGKPFLDYLIDFLVRYKIKKIILLTKYKYQQFNKLYDGKIINQTNIKCINQKKFLGTSGSLKNVLHKLDKKFILCNGDTIFDFNLFDFNKKLKKNFVGILACSSAQTNTDRYSKFHIGSEKLVSAGIYLFHKEKIKKYLLSQGSLENEVIQKIPKSKFQKISYKKKFIDIGIPKDLSLAKKILKNLETKKCVFLDRDGVINYDYGYVHTKKKFKWKKNIFNAIKLLNDNSYLVIVVSNQSGVGRGFYSIKDVDALHEWMNNQLISYGAFIDKFYYAPYFEFAKIRKFREGKEFRKPNTGMLKKALREFKIDKKNSFFIGDKDSDRKTAKKFKIKYFNVDNNTDLYSLLKTKINYLTQ